MSTRIQEWLQTENTVVKSYEQLEAENAETGSTLEYNEKVVKPWMEQNQMEDEIRKTMGVPPSWASDREKIEFYQRQLALLEKANQAPRCGHVYSDGTRCRAPRLRKDKVCYAHARMLAVRPRKLNLPPLEDANALMLWLMEVSRALLEGEITERTAGLLFYGLQMAMVAARWTTFAQTKPEEMVRTMPEAGRSFTAKNAKDLAAESTESRARRPEETQAGAPFDQLRAGSAVHRSFEMVRAMTEGDSRKRRDGTKSEKSFTAEDEESRGRRPEETQAGAPFDQLRAGSAVHRSFEIEDQEAMIAGDETAKSLSTGDEGVGGGYYD